MCANFEVKKWGSGSSAEEVFTEVRNCSINGIEGEVSEVNEYDDVLGGGTIGEGSKSLIFLTLVNGRRKGFV